MAGKFHSGQTTMAALPGAPAGSIVVSSVEDNT